MMNEGTNSLTAEQFEIALEKLGSRINVSASRDRMVIDVRTLSRNLEPTLALLEQRLLESDFTEENLERLRLKQLESLEASREQPRSIANEVYGKLLYGQESPFAIPLEGTPESVSAITLDEVRSFARDSMATQALQVIVVGDVQQDALLPKLVFLDDLRAQALPSQSLLKTGQVASNTLYLVDKPGAFQSEIRIGYLTDMPYDATGEYFKSSLMNYVLGGTFNSRINLNLREDKGYTYGASSGFSSTKIPGPFTASSSVKVDASAASVNEFMMEIQSYANEGINADELDFMRASIVQRDALNYETPRQKSGFLGRMLEYSLQPDFTQQQSEIIRTISAEEIDALASSKLPYQDMLILVVGDKAVIGESIAELGFSVRELSSAGDPLE